VDIERTRLEILKELDPNFEISMPTVETLPAKQDSPVNSTPMDSSLSTNLSDPLAQAIDVRKRYDVYCSERNHNVVIYRNALFKGLRKLLPEERRDALSDFCELEQADGKTVFVAIYSVIKFCEPGVTLNSENVPSQQP